MAGNTIIELVEEIKQEGTFDYIEITGDSINPPGTYIDVYHGKYKVSLRRLNNPSPLMHEGNEVNGYVDFVEILKKNLWRLQNNLKGILYS